MDARSVVATIPLPRSKVPAWFYHAIGRLWAGPVSSRSEAFVTQSRIAVKAGAQSSSGCGVNLGITIDIGDNEQSLCVIADKIPSPALATPLLPSLPRFSHHRMRADVEIVYHDVEQDESRIQVLLEQVRAQFEESARMVTSGSAGSYVVGILLRVDANWPPGRFEFAGYQAGLVHHGNPFDGSMLLLTRIVRGFSGSECKFVWHDALNTCATALGILTDRDIFLSLKPVPAEVKQALDLAFYPPLLERAESSKQLSLLASLDEAEVESPFRDRPKSGFVNFIPNDLGTIVEAFESQPEQRVKIISEALTAFQMAFDLKDKYPTLSLSTYWTVLERLLDWYNIPKFRQKACGCSESCTIDAVKKLLALLPGYDNASEEIGTVLYQMFRLVRNPWTHAGRLVAKDLSARPEIWTATSEKDVPVWTYTDDLLLQAEDFCRHCLEIVLIDASQPPN